MRCHCYPKLLTLEVHINRKFFLCRYKLSPLKYTKLAMLQAFKVTLFALKNGLQIARPKGQNVTWCDVILVARSVQYLVWRFFPHISTFSWFLEAFRIARHRLTFGAARTHWMSLKVDKLLQPTLRHNSTPVPRISWPFLRVHHTTPYHTIP